MSGSAPDTERVLRRLEWTVIRRLDGLSQGDYRSLFRGFGLDLADLREYQPSDDVRHIDWNVTARMQTPHVRIYNEDRDVTAWFVLDLSPSVDFGSGEVTKRQLVTEFAAVISRLLTRQGNKVGAFLFDGRHTAVLPPGSGRRHVLRLMEMIRSFPHLLHAPQTDLGAFLRKADSLIKRRAIVFAASDFIALPGWHSALGAMARRHEVTAVRLVDPMENTLPDVGMMVFQDAETGEQMFVDTGDKGFRKRFAAMAEQNEEALYEAFFKAGTDVLELSTGDDLFDAILRFTTMRKVQSRMSGGAVGMAGS